MTTLDRRSWEHEERRRAAAGGRSRAPGLRLRAFRFEGDPRPCFRCVGQGLVVRKGAPDPIVKCPDCGGDGLEARHA